MKKITIITFILLSMNSFGQVTENFTVGRSLYSYKWVSKLDLSVIVGNNDCEDKLFMNWCVDYESLWLRVIPELKELLVNYRKDFILKDLDTPKNRISLIRKLNLILDEFYNKIE